MSARKIKCCECMNYMGEVREASLRKDINYICDKCLVKLRLARNESKQSRAPQNDIPDWLGGIMGGMGK